VNEALAQSVKARLVNHAKGRELDPNHVLRRYALERFLYRLSVTPDVDRFALKGAFMLVAWLGEEVRPTKDVDLLRFGDTTDDVLEELFGDVCDIDMPDDAMSFDRSTIEIQQIRDDDPYAGRRMTLRCRLGNARLRIQIDVGVGDAVVPDAEWFDYPSLLDLPGPRLRAYSPETAIAEKTHALVTLGAANSRMKDFFDIWLLSQRRAFSGPRLSAALDATFERRDTALPEALPFGLRQAFVDVEGKQAQWTGFLDKNGLTSAPRDLRLVIDDISKFIGPVLLASSESDSTSTSWPPGGPWHE
jgi:hypothetical protein